MTARMINRIARWMTCSCAACIGYVCAAEPSTERLAGEWLAIAFIVFAVIGIVTDEIIRDEQ